MAVYNVTILMEQEAQDSELYNYLSLNEDLDIINEGAIAKIGDIINGIKPNPELSKYVSDLEYAERLLADSNVKVDVKPEKALRTANNLINMVIRLTARVGTQTAALKVPGIKTKMIAMVAATAAGSLISRVLKVGRDAINQKIVIKETEKILAAYDNAINKCCDEAVKKKMQLNRDTIASNLNDMKNGNKKQQPDQNDNKVSVKNPVDKEEDDKDE